MRYDHKLTTEEIKAIIRNSGNRPAKDEDTPYADVPSAQEPTRPFEPARHEQLQEASVQYGRQNQEVEPSYGSVQRHMFRANGSGYLRAVIGSGNSTPSLGKFTNALLGKGKHK
jgi:hypothetical protein